jgi:GNAT superfamily N-acetyltransferase
MMLRDLVPADADPFAALVRQAFAGLALEPAPSAMRLSGGDVRAHLAAGGGGAIVPPMQGGVLWAEAKGGLYVSRMAVHPAHRRQGLAVAMLQAAEREALRLGLPRLWLATRLALTGNRRLFAAFGFVETDLHTHPGYTEPTFVDMEKVLAGEPKPALRVYDRS